MSTKKLELMFVTETDLKVGTMDTETLVELPKEGSYVDLFEGEYLIKSVKLSVVHRYWKAIVVPTWDIQELPVMENVKADPLIDVENHIGHNKRAFEGLIEYLQDKYKQPYTIMWESERIKAVSLRDFGRQKNVGPESVRIVKDFMLSL